MNIYTQSKFLIYLIAVASLIVSSLWGLYSMAPGSIKFIFSMSIWGCVVLFPFSLIKRNDFAKSANYILQLLLLITVVQIIRSIFNSSLELTAVGNKWLTLFGNEYSAIMMLPPLFAYLGTLTLGVNILKNTTYAYLISGLVLSIFMKFPLAFLSTFVIVFYPYVGKKFRILIILAYVEALIKATTGDNPTRMLLIIVVFSFCSYVLVYVIKNIKLIKAFAIVLIIAPMLIFVPVLFSVNQKEPTIFEKAQEYVMQKRVKREMATDTRTFLYYELSEDLTKTHSWLFGKGAYSRYYSPYFDDSSIGKYGRLSLEVPFLTHLLKGGICYVVLYYGLLLSAVYLGIWRSKNKFIQSIAIIAVGWYFNCFIGDITGCRFYHLAFFLLLGCCFSRKWLNRSDRMISFLMGEKHVIAQASKHLLP